MRKKVSLVCELHPIIRISSLLVEFREPYLDDQLVSSGEYQVGDEYEPPLV